MDDPLLFSMRDPLRARTLIAGAALLLVAPAVAATSPIAEAHDASGFTAKVVASSVVARIGHPATITASFSNALASHGTVKIKCAWSITAASGGGPSHSPGKVCYEGIPGPANVLTPTSLHLTADVVKGFPSDTFIYEIDLTDMHRNVTLPVRVSVKMDESGGAE